MIEFLWQTNEKSADYSFNKSHAACYGLIAYRTAWLKANYTAEYMAALISSVMSTKDKVPFFVARCEEMGIEILPPDVNLSDHEFTVVEGNIRFGLDAVKGVGHQAVEAIKRAREETTGQSGARPRVHRPAQRVHLAMGLLRARGQPHRQQEGDRGADQVRRVRLHRVPPARGCSPCSSRLRPPGRRPSRTPRSDRARSSTWKARAAHRTAGERSAPAWARGLDARPGSARRGRGFDRLPPIPAEEFDQAELLAAEKEAIGLFVSAHPLKPVREALRARADCPLAALAGRRDKDWVTVGGIVTESKRIRTRNGDHMMFATLDDLEGSVEMLVFGKALAEHEAVLAVDQVVLVRGRVDHKEAGKTCLVVQSAETFAPSEQEVADARAASARAAKPARPVCLRIDATKLPASAIDELKHVIGNFPGPAEVVLEMDTTTGPRRLRLGEAYRVDPTPTLRAELEQVLAPACLAVA